MHLFPVAADGTDQLGTNLTAEKIATMEPDELARLIGLRILLKSSFGRRLYGEVE